MKKTIVIIFVIATCMSCSKDDVQPLVSDPYLSVSVNSVWNYQIYDSVALTTTPYTLTSINRDSLIGARSYHVYTNSIGPNEYYNISNTNYFAFESVPPPANNGSKVENLYLIEDPEGTTWVQSHIVSIYPPQTMIANFTNEIFRKGITKVVHNITYTNVIHVKTKITLSGLNPNNFISEINSFFAPKVGMIQKDLKVQWLNVPQPSGPPATLTWNTSKKLMSATIL